MSGYSKTPLQKKLGYKEGFRVRVINRPDGYEEWIADAPAHSLEEIPPFDLVHFFVNDVKALEETLARLRFELVPNGIIWVSWYKKASKLPTEITEDTIRDTALAIGLVDVKVCAVTDIWSGLKLVIRKELR